MQAERLAAAVGGILLAGFLSTAALGQELGPTVGTETLERISQSHDRAIDYYKRGLYDRAIAEYDQAIKLKPDYANAYYNRGVAYMSKGLYDRAIEDYDTAIRLRPDYAKAYRNRGNAKFYLGRFAAAARDYDQSLNIDPEQIFRVIWLYLARERSEENGGQELARNATKVDLSDWPGPVVSMFLGEVAPQQVLAAAKHPDERKQRERECEAFFYIGQYHLLQGNKGEAAKLFRKALDTGITHFVEYIGAKAELERLGL